jgi:hypothetical protein
MRLPYFTAEQSLYPNIRCYRTGPTRMGVTDAALMPADVDVVPTRLCRDGRLVPCAPVPCGDGGVCWDCLHVCPEDPPAEVSR